MLLVIESIDHATLQTSNQNAPGPIPSSASSMVKTERDVSHMKNNEKSAPWAEPGPWNNWIGPGPYPGWPGPGPWYNWYKRGNGRPGFARIQTTSPVAESKQRWRSPEDNLKEFVKTDGVLTQTSNEN